MTLTLRRSAVALISLFATVLGACTRIETGEVGLRINFDKTTDPVERLPGSFNQTLIGSILTFKIQDVAVSVDNMTPRCLSCGPPRTGPSMVWQAPVTTSC
jgi:hypothetical protein